MPPEGRRGFAIDAAFRSAFYKEGAKSGVRPERLDGQALQLAEHAGFVRAGAPSPREQFYSTRQALAGWLP